jgi:hypothetical protein
MTRHTRQLMRRNKKRLYGQISKRNQFQSNSFFKRLKLYSYEGSCIIYLICVCLSIVVSNTYWLYESRGGCLGGDRGCLTFVSPWVYPWFLVGSVLPIFLVFCVVIFALFVLVLCLVYRMMTVFQDCTFFIALRFFLTFI